jgi:hypothetical protein
LPKSFKNGIDSKKGQIRKDLKINAEQIAIGTVIFNSKFIFSYKYYFNFFFIFS